MSGFHGGRVLIERADGARVAAWAPPYPVLLHDLARRGAWEKAVRLCRWARRARERLVPAPSSRLPPFPNLKMHSSVASQR